MRIDERRVAEGKATLWRTMLGKGPKVSDEGDGIIVQGPVDSQDDTVKTVAQSAVDRNVQNVVA
jgi:hypothetical protein